ncbi:MULTISPECIES: CsiV family protein [unclassified Shewanella]|uniref:CsiV family protein n=1 Tax=unclassified Shewanella TaxID=196818 RepID=UPI0039B69F47
MYRNMLATLVLGLTLSPVLQAAQYPWYEVEVYLFERPGPSTEKWPDTPLELKLNKTIDLITPQVATEISSSSMAGGDCDPQWQSQSAGSAADKALNNDASGSQRGRPLQAGQVISLAQADNTTQADATALPCQQRQAEIRMPKQLPVNISPRDSSTAAQPGALLLSESRAQFGGVINALKRQRGLKGLLHLTWQQQMKPRHRAEALHLFGGRNFGSDFKLSGLPQSQLDTASNSSLNGLSEDLSEEKLPEQALDNGLSEPTQMGSEEYAALGSLMVPQTPKAVWELDGLLNIYLSHYLYVETRFNLREAGYKSLATQEGEPELQTPFLYSIPMEQNRRIRSGEIHYFDHPRMGMILQVRRMAQPGSQTQAESSEEL